MCRVLAGCAGTRAVRLAMAVLWLLVALPGHAAEPAQMMPRAVEGLLLDVAAAGTRLLAVGERGHILVSEDAGRHWTQVAAPTRAMLTAVWFADASTGWAVGHDGVVLGTRDGGLHWELQRDGLQAQEQINRDVLERARVNLVTQEAAPEPDSAALEDARFALEDAEATLAEPLFAPPLLDLWFRDASHGIAVGGYGSCVVTADGGRTWADASARFDNPDRNHLYAIAALGDGRLLVAGEAGRLFRSADDGASWQALEIGHAGTLFALLPGPGAAEVRAFGLQGAAMLSSDAGDTWEMLDSGTGVVLAGAAPARDGSAWVVGSVGTVLRARGARMEAVDVPLRRAHLAAALETPDGALVVVGQGGAQRLDAVASGAPQTGGR